LLAEDARSNDAARMSLAAPWVATAVLLVGLGSDPGGGPEWDSRGAGDRAPVADDPVSRLERTLVASASAEPVWDTPDAPSLSQADRGPAPLGGLLLIGAVARRRRAATRLASSSPRGPPGRPGPPIASFPLVPSRIDNIPLDLPYRWSSGRGPPASCPRSTCVPRSARLTTRAQETEP
jgi:hypothetical protein